MPSWHALACWKARPDLVQCPLGHCCLGVSASPGGRETAPLHLFPASLCPGILGQFLSSRTAAENVPQNIPSPQHTHTNFAPKKKAPKAFC